MPNSDASPLPSALNLGPLTIRNRIVMAPLTRSPPNTDGVTSPFAADYYAQRESARLIVSETANV